MKKLVFFLALSIMSLCFFSCSNEEKKTEVRVNRDTIIQRSEQQTSDIPQKVEEQKEVEKIADIKLSLQEMNLLYYIDSLPLGTNSNKIKQIFSSAKGPFVEGDSKELGAQGLTEIFVNTTIIGKNAFLEFNFKNDSLYSYYYSLNEPDQKKSERIYQTLQHFYSKKLGIQIEGKVEEENHYTQTCYWKGQNFYTVLTHNLNTNTVSWGFQGTEP